MRDDRRERRASPGRLDEERVRDARRRVGLRLVERLGLEQRLGERLELVAVLDEQSVDLRVRLVDEPPDLVVDHLLGVARRSRAAPGEQRACASAGITATGPMAGAHPPAADHLPGDRGHLLDVGLGARGDVVEHDLLGHPAAERDLDLACR